MGINWKSWLLSGLVAGFFINASGVVLAHHVLGVAYIAAYREHVAHPLPVAAVMAQNLSLRFGFGLLGMFFYVAFRPRFGPGPGTALLAGAALAVGTYVPAILHQAQFGILSGAAVWVGLVWSVMEALVACLLGAWIYREGPGRPRIS